MSEFYETIDNLKKKPELDKFCLEKNNYVQGKSKYGTLWPVWECSLVDTAVNKEINSIFTINPDYMLLSKTGSQGLPRHFDITKWSVLNIPICGDFIESPILFVDDLDNIIDSSDYKQGTTPILFNARALHAVLPSSIDRVALSLCWRIEYNIIKNKYLDGTLMNNYNGSFFFVNDGRETIK